MEGRPATTHHPVEAGDVDQEDVDQGDVDQEDVDQEARDMDQAIKVHVHLCILGVYPQRHLRDNLDFNLQLLLAK